MEIQIMEMKKKMERNENIEEHTGKWRWGNC